MGNKLLPVLFYAPDQMIGAYCFCPVCLSGLSNDTKVNDLVTYLTLTFVLKLAFFYFVVTGGIVFYKHMHFFKPPKFVFPLIWL